MSGRKSVRQNHGSDYFSHPIIPDISFGFKTDISFSFKTDISFSFKTDISFSFKNYLKSCAK